MSLNRVTYTLSAPSWLTLIEVQAARLLLFAAVASGIAVFSVAVPKTTQALEYAWCLSEEGALESTLQHIASLRRDV
jgi:hypothetical protein